MSNNEKSLSDIIKDRTSIEKSAKTVDDAIAEALKALNAKREEVDVTVIDEGAKGLLGVIGSKPARVMVKVKHDPEFTAKMFLREVLVCMGIMAEIETKLKERQLLVNIKGDNAGMIIGKRGQTLDALQYLTGLVVNRGGAPFIAIILDTENYRQRRKETLEALAFGIAKKVKQTRKNVVLEPMNPYERRIIHSALQSDKHISTYSEGEEPYRYVVVAYKF
ncbi:MAG: protein jag [Clostridiales bacterium]|jgi:spoIIIJ-associated protein|nr:protein jag [Clostridiales bacterium]